MAKKTKSPAAAVPLKLQGKSVFLAGNFYYQAGDLHGLIGLEGGTVVKELTDKTNIMVAGWSSANPRKKAVKLNAHGAAIQVVEFDQFLQSMKPTPDESVKLLLSGAKGIERWNRHHGGDANPHMQYVAGYRRGGQTALLRGVDFANADLSGADFTGGAEHCDFTGTMLKGCYLHLSHCQLDGAMLDGVVELDLADCTARKTDFSRVAADYVSIKSTDLSGSRFANGPKVTTSISQIARPNALTSRALKHKTRLSSANVI